MLSEGLSVARMKRAINMRSKQYLKKKKKNIRKLQPPLSFEMESHRRSKETVVCSLLFWEAPPCTRQSPRG